MIAQVSQTCIKSQPYGMCQYQPKSSKENTKSRNLLAIHLFKAGDNHTFGSFPDGSAELDFPEQRD